MKFKYSTVDQKYPDKNVAIAQGGFIVYGKK